MVRPKRQKRTFFAFFEPHGYLGPAVVCVYPSMDRHVYIRSKYLVFAPSLAASLFFIFFLLLHLDANSLMLPPCNTSSLPDVNASSSLPSHNAVSHKQVAPVSENRRKQPLVDCRRLPTVGLDASQPSDIFSNLAVPTTISRFPYSASRTANTGTPTRDLTRPEFVLHAPSDSLPSQEQSFPGPSQRRRVLLTRHHSEPIIRTVPAQTEPSSPYFWSSATETQNRRRRRPRRRSSQHDITRILPSQTVSADRGSSIADTGEHVCL
jgi:hypothetical protein